MRKLSLFLAATLFSINAFGTTEVDIVKKFKKDHKEFVKYQYSENKDRLSMCYMFLAMNDTYNRLSADQKLLAVNKSNEQRINKSFSIGNKECKYWVQ